MGFVIMTFIRHPVIRVPLMLIMLVGWAFELFILDLNGTLLQPKSIVDLVARTGVSFRGGWRLWRIELFEIAPSW